MALFLGFLALTGALRQIGGSFWLASAEYWVYPLQTITCATLLFFYRSQYELRPFRNRAFAIGAGVFTFLIWIAPQALFGAEPRRVGFNPETFIAEPLLYWPTVAFRFLRLVLVVPLVEEIFWRGFLLRYFVNEKFSAVPLGTFSWPSFAFVTLGFAIVHSPADWPAAVVTGALYNFVAYRTKSLGSCVLTHAATNLLLGGWIMATRQWGFW